MSETRAALIYTPLPDTASGRALAQALLEERLIACANILGPIESIFIWQGRSESATEVGVLFKTTAAQLDRAIDRLSSLHPYETPAIIANVCDAAAPETLGWLAEQTQL